MMQLLSLHEMSSCFLQAGLCWNARCSLNYSVWVGVNMIWCQPMSRGSTIQSVQRKRKYFHFVIMKPDNRNYIYHSLSTTKWHSWGRAVIWDKQDSLLVICQRWFGSFLFYLVMMWCHPIVFTFPKDSDGVKQMWSTSGTKHLYVKEIFSEKKVRYLCSCLLYI